MRSSKRYWTNSIRWPSSSASAAARSTSKPMFRVGSSASLKIYGAPPSASAAQRSGGSSADLSCRPHPRAAPSHARPQSQIARPMRCFNAAALPAPLYPLAAGRQQSANRKPVRRRELRRAPLIRPDAETAGKSRLNRRRSSAGLLQFNRSRRRLSRGTDGDLSSSRGDCRGGFGGLYCAQSLRRAPVLVTLVDRRNFHLFQPLLYQVATGGLSPANIAAPLRSVLKRQRNAEVLLGNVCGFDLVGRRVLLSDGTVPFDFLVVAAGSETSYFGHDAWEPLAPGLKTIEDATAIRRRVLLAFEAPSGRPTRRRFAAGSPSSWWGAADGRRAGRRPGRNRPAHPAKRIPQDRPRPHHRPAPRRRRPAAPGLSARALREGPRAVEAARRAGPHRGDRVRGPARRCELPLRRPHRGRPVPDRSLGSGCTGLAAGRTPRRGRRRRDGPAGARPRWARSLRRRSSGGLRDRRPGPVQPSGSLAALARPGSGGDAARTLRRPAHRPPPSGADACCVSLSRPRHDGHDRTRTRRGDGRPVPVRRVMGLARWLFVHLIYLIQFENRVLVLFQWAWSYVTWNRSARLITGEGPLSGPPPAPSAPGS